MFQPQRDVDQRFFNFPSIAICAAQMEPVVVGWADTLQSQLDYAS